MTSCFRTSRKNVSWRTSVSVCLLISFGVLCLLSLASGAQPAYNQSGAANKQGQHQASSLGKDRSEDADVASGPPPMRYSRTNSKGYSSPPKSPASMYTSSAYGYYPVSDSYYDDDYYRPPARQFSARSVSSYPMMAAVAATQTGFHDSDYAATGHGGGGGGHGEGHAHGGGHGGGGQASGSQGGWGWGWGGGSVHQSSKSGPQVDNSSLGLLGLLGLLSLLSNVLLLLTTTTTAAPAARLKREVVDPFPSPFTDLQLDNEIKVEQICQKMLPSLNIIGHIQNGKIPVNCSHHEVCTTNQILVNEFGIQGRSVGSMLSTAIIKMLKEVNQSPALDKYLRKASLDGRNGEDCESVYPTCKELGNYFLPQLVSPEQVTTIVLRKNPRLVPSSD